jgi:hypothetical protein
MFDSRHKPTFGRLFGTTLVLVALVGTLAVAGPQEVTKEGVVHVMNPTDAKERPTEMELEEEWRLGGEDDEEIFGVITAITSDDDGNFYLLDAQLNEIKVYDEDGEYLRTIGREGEGPGEFRGAFNMFMLPGGDIGVLQVFPGKIVKLTPDGEPAGEFELPETEGGGFRVLFAGAHAGDNLALVYGMNQPSESGFTQKSVLSLVGSDQTERELHSTSSAMKAASPKIAEKEWDVFRNGRWAAAADGRAFAAPDYGEYKINMWSSDGKLERVIHREYPDHKRSDEEKTEIEEIYKGFTKRIPIPNIEYVIEDVYNQISRMYVRDNGELWVQTSRGTNGVPDGVLGIFDVFDKKGHFVKQVTLKGDGNPETDGFFFVKDRLFVVTDFLAAMMALQGGGGDEGEADEDEPELMEIISYKLDS